MAEVIQAIDQELRDCGFESRYFHNFTSVIDQNGVFQFVFTIDGADLHVDCQILDISDPQAPYPAWWYKWGRTKKIVVDLNDPKLLAGFLNELIEYCHGADRPSRGD
jgi:hypothetical protein